MKKLITIALAALSLTALAQTSNRVPEDAVRELCEYMVRVYPRATLQDIYKTCYQDFFGAEHHMQDTAAARKYLCYELEQMTNDEVMMPMHEPTGFRHRFVRVNLALVLNGEMNEEELLCLFIDAARKDNALHDLWADEWEQVESIALQVHPQWQDAELQKALREAAANKLAVHHSASFREAYHPHYRIIINR